jgi:hypothetical protein
MGQVHVCVCGYCWAAALCAAQSNDCVSGRGLLLPLCQGTSLETLEPPGSSVVLAMARCGSLAVAQSRTAGCKTCH